MTLKAVADISLSSQISVDIEKYTKVNGTTHHLTKTEQTRNLVAMSWLRGNESNFFAPYALQHGSGYAVLPNLHLALLSCVFRAYIRGLG